MGSATWGLCFSHVCVVSIQNSLAHGGHPMNDGHISNVCLTPKSPNHCAFQSSKCPYDKVIQQKYSFSGGAVKSMMFFSCDLHTLILARFAITSRTGPGTEQVLNKYLSVGRQRREGRGEEKREGGLLKRPSEKQSFALWGG